MREDRSDFAPGYSWTRIGAGINLKSRSNLSLKSFFQKISFRFNKFIESAHGWSFKLSIKVFFSNLKIFQRAEECLQTFDLGYRIVEVTLDSKFYLFII